jgi:hypothetical protein
LSQRSDELPRSPLSALRSPGPRALPLRRRRAVPASRGLRPMRRARRVGARACPSSAFSSRPGTCSSTPPFEAAERCVSSRTEPAAHVVLRFCRSRHASALPAGRRHADPSRERLCSTAERCHRRRERGSARSATRFEADDRNLRLRPLRGTAGSGTRAESRHARARILRRQRRDLEVDGARPALQRGRVRPRGDARGHCVSAVGIPPSESGGILGVCPSNLLRGTLRFPRTPWSLRDSPKSKGSPPRNSSAYTLSR